MNLIPADYQPPQSKVKDRKYVILKDGPKVLKSATLWGIKEGLVTLTMGAYDKKMHSLLLIFLL